MAAAGGRAEQAREATPGSILMVVHEFVARSPDELSLSKGDRIELIERDDDFGDGWYLGRHMQTGATGLFPEVYTTLAPRSYLGGRNRTNTPTGSSAGVGTGSGSATGGAAPASTSSNIPGQGPAQSLNSIMKALDQPSPPSTSAGNIQRAPPATSPSQAQGGARESSRVPSHNSTVMDQTLSVIDEHITGMRVPENTKSKPRVASHSSREEPRISYIAGDETEEEEEAHRYSRKEVLTWSADQVAEYLEDVGVEKSHCEVFREQEFTGEVLLAMEQSTVFLKELELGPIGRRLKTWGKIKALQDEVNMPAPSSKIKHMSEQPHQSPLGIISEVASNPQGARPSAASVRSFNQSKRTSSYETGLSPDMARGHVKQNSQHSLDRGWTMSPANRSTSAISDTRGIHYPSASAEAAQTHTSARESQATLSTSHDVDRGYVSGGELEIAPKHRRLLRKKEQSSQNHSDHQRQSSYESAKKRMSFFSKKSSRAQTPIDTNQISAPGSVQHLETGAGRDGPRIVSEPLTGDDGPPTVTKLEYGNNANRYGFTSEDASQLESTENEREGQRIASDAVTGREKAMHKIAVDHLSDSQHQSPRSSTPSDFPYDDPKLSMAAPPQTSASRKKTKKDTSAYLLGLEKKTPQEQISDADFSGWMKKKSSTLMTSWKPRLFILKGRRLSYYYSETDTEEKGVIDISGHRVLSADNEKLTGLHASLTGAKASPTSPNATSIMSPTAMTNSPVDMTESPIDTNGLPLMTTTLNNAAGFSKDPGGGFIFKLVPPRSGMSKAVNFTKPAIHYFAVPSLEEGRLWMAALMKATIDRDESADVITTYQQKTISLAKARARKERPPALQNLEEDTPAEPGLDEHPGSTPSEINMSMNSMGSLSAPLDSNRFAGHTPNSFGSPGQREQVTPVTDLENTFSRTRTNSSVKGRGSRDKQTNRNVSNEGLGINVEDNSPILSRMQSSGLW